MVCVCYTGKLVAQLEQELKRLQRRKTMDTTPTTVGVASTYSREQPLFTLRQVSIVLLSVSRVPHVDQYSTCGLAEHFRDAVCYGKKLP